MSKLLGASKSDAIKGRTLNLTVYSSVAAAVAAAITALNGPFEEVFGKDLTPTQVVETKLTLAVAIIVAFALIVVADMLARAWASSADRTIVTPVPGTPGAKTVDGDGFTIAAMRVKAGAPDEIEYLLIKPGAEPTWEAAAKVRLAAGT